MRMVDVPRKSPTASSGARRGFCFIARTMFKTYLDYQYALSTGCYY